MSTISGVGGASSAWAEMSASRASAMKDKMFAKVDKDGSGSVDKSELQGMLDHMAERSGTTAASADDMLGKMDSDGDGSLNKDELDAGMKSLMPPPSSTMAFAQQRTEGGGPPPPPSGGGGDRSEGSSTSGTSGSSSTDPLDTNGDGVVSPQERAAGEMKDLMNALVSSMDTDGDKKVSKDELDSFNTKLDQAFASSDTGNASSGSGASSSSSSGSDQSGLDVAALTNRLLKAYSAMAADYAQSASFSEVA